MTDALVRHLTVFGRVLREAGLEVGPGRIQDALRGLDVFDLTCRDDELAGLVAAARSK